MCRRAVPSVAPMISWATVPTTISDNAVATRSQIDNRVATRARPNHRAARNQVSVTTVTLAGYSSDGTVGGSAESGLITPKRAGICA